MGACKLANWYVWRPPALLLPKNKCESCEREEACRQHTSKAVALATAARYLWPQGERLQKKDFLFAEVDSEDLC